MKEEIKDFNINDLKFHKIANMHRKMNELEYRALKQSIDEIGQQVPIYVYRGKIVDGRHRYKAMYELNYDKIKGIEIPRNTTLQEIEEIVMSTENRRTDTPAQKAIRAYYWMSEDLSRTIKDASIKFGINRTDLSMVKNLVNMIGTREINLMFEKGYVVYKGKKYTSIQTLYKTVKKDIEQPYVTDKEYEPTTDETKKIYELANSLRGNLIELAKARTYIDKIMKETKEIE